LQVFHPVVSATAKPFNPGFRTIPGCRRHH
jgi:hypothetical protein